MIFNSKSYLTIDDSPSTRMDDLVDYLLSKNIPAMFFCRGDLLEENSSSAIRALQKGFVLANHAYSHQRSSQKDFSWVVNEIERTEKLLDDIHATANVKKKGNFFRFPQLDRGTAGWIADYDTYDAKARDELLGVFASGLNVQSMERPSKDDFQKRDRLQKYLAMKGYTQPFIGVTHSWFKNGDLAGASDCLYTYSNCDWMLTARHLGKWPYQNIEDLKLRARADKTLTGADCVNIILAHDQAEILDITIELIEDLSLNGMEFLPIL